MEVKLIVANGEDKPHEVLLSSSQCFIGRAEECQLRPRSELVSRHHCVIIVEEEFVGVRDLGSTHGTLVNGEKVRGERELKDGDRLRAGDMEFEVRLDADVDADDKPDGGGIEEGAARIGPESIDDELDLDKWLDETDTQVPAPGKAASPAAESNADVDTSSSERQKGKQKRKPTEVVGVWKKGHWKPTSANPGTAAADALKDFFKKGGR